MGDPKRQRLSFARPSADLASYPRTSSRSNASYLDDFDANNQRLNVAFQPLLEATPSGPWTQQRPRSKKRAFERLRDANELPRRYQNDFPSLYPIIPGSVEAPVKLCFVQNPFWKDNEPLALHPRLRTPLDRENLEQRGLVNAFIKVAFDRGDESDKDPAQPFVPGLPFPESLAEARAKEAERATSGVELQLQLGPDAFKIEDLAAPLPPDFGGVKFNYEIERQTFEFFVKGLCSGRTTIHSDNTYRTEIAPMAETSALVKHAILSLSATYIMDFQVSEHLELFARVHQGHAVKLLGSELNNGENYKPGKGEPVVAALMLLSHNEVVNWEADMHEDSPAWYRSGEKAGELLEKSNPAHLYGKSVHVQLSRARHGLGQLFCLDNVMSDCLYPLDPSKRKCSFSWLISGDNEQAHKIVGMTGLSSQLMHYFAKITFISGMLYKNPALEASLMIAKSIERNLENFHQWSDITVGYETSEELIAACGSRLDKEGKVSTPADVTDLIAESYAAAAQIYVMCRALRYPRQHSKVQKIVERLLKCVDWQPTSGDLFTAQTPLFAVFVAGMVAYKPHHRDVIRKWFLPTSDESRGNVKPAWHAMQDMWTWLDERDKDRDALNDDALMQSTPGTTWWEAAVGDLSHAKGRLNFS